MEQDFIIELEKKINSLISSYETIKKEKEQLTQDINTKNNRIQELEGEIDRIGTELHTLRDTTSDQKKKLDSAASKVRELITKLEAVD